MSGHLTFQTVTVFIHSLTSIKLSTMQNLDFAIY